MQSLNCEHLLEVKYSLITISYQTSKYLWQLSCKLVSWFVILFDLCVSVRWLTWDLGDLAEVGEDVADHFYMDSLTVVTSVARVKKNEGAVGLAKWP